MERNEFKGVEKAEKKLPVVSCQLPAEWITWESEDARFEE